MVIYPVGIAIRITAGAGRQAETRGADPAPPSTLKGSSTILQSKSQITLATDYHFMDNRHQSRTR